MKSHALLLFVAAFVTSAQTTSAASFTPIGRVGVRSSAFGVSADGSTVAGSFADSRGRSVGSFVWSSANGLQDLGILPGGTSQQFALGISPDGATVVGSNATATGSEAFAWDAEAGTRGLGMLPGSLNSTARAVSNDGSVIVGEDGGQDPLDPTSLRAVIWEAGRGVRALGDLPGVEPIWSSATDVSADGTVVVGWGTSGEPGTLTIEREAFIWDVSNGMRGLGGLPGQPAISRATAISRDGATVVGYARVEGLSGPDYDEPFVWDAARGMRSLGAFAGARVSVPLDVSDGGSTVVGYMPFPFAGTDLALIWAEESGPQRVDFLLQSLGIDLAGWRLERANGISADGTTIVGTGIDPSGQRQAWIAVIPEPTSALLLGAGLMGLALAGRPRPSNPD